jgi:hypothetical protein
LFSFGTMGSAFAPDLAWPPKRTYAFLDHRDKAISALSNSKHIAQVKN